MKMQNNNLAIISHVAEYLVVKWPIRFIFSNYKHSFSILNSSQGFLDRVFCIGMEDGGGVKRQRVVDVRREDAERIHGLLMAFSALLTEADLQDPTKVMEVYHFSHRTTFDYMGRPLTKELIDFIEEERPEVKLPESKIVSPPGKRGRKQLRPYGIYGFRYITGTPGAGKSCSVAASVLYLYGKFARDRIGSSSRPRRIMLVDGAQMAWAPENTLWDGLFQAFVDDNAALQELEAIEAGQVSIFDVENFLKRMINVDLTIVVDDGNMARDSPGVQSLCRLLEYCVVVFCASISSVWTQVLRHPKAPQYKLVVGGLNDKELASYLNLFQFQRVDLSKTGRVPRLLDQFDTDMEVFHQCIISFEADIRTFIQRHLGGNVREHLQKELTGTETVPRLPLLLEPKCFYVGKDGTLEALTPHFHSYALSTLAGLMREDDLDEQRKQVTFWVQAVAKDDNMARIGWNAEMAGILSTKFMTQGFYYAQGKRAHITVKHVLNFHGPMSGKLLSVEGTMHVPYDFNHAGIDTYLEDENFIVALHFSVAKNAITHHKKTAKKAEELFVGDKRIKVLVWVIYTDRWVSYRATSRVHPGLEYYVVVMPFSFFSVQLSRIDETLDELRKNTARTDLQSCSDCWEDRGDAPWVQCDVCDLWYHQPCVHYNPALVVDPEQGADLVEEAGEERRNEVNCVTQILCIPFIF
ncbi:hypothetical protein SELMODRAFT_449370 [Selaginella moellendorffii]|uniref:Uncharacterized protein n=1 Tax=Selaginella moellendorffii TaxID=88036 RepID=D8TFV6_SELML|nr:hypothetical protein SELMODRAFT_449370 [Selaginella moellendorffii]